MFTKCICTLSILFIAANFKFPLHNFTTRHWSILVEIFCHLTYILARYMIYLNKWKNACSLLKKSHPQIRLNIFHFWIFTTGLSIPVRRRTFFLLNEHNLMFYRPFEPPCFLFFFYDQARSQFFFCVCVFSTKQKKVH